MNRKHLLNIIIIGKLILLFINIQGGLGMNYFPFQNVELQHPDLIPPSQIPHKSLSSYNYTPHEPIFISSDIELKAIAVNGLGTETEPYILEGWKIITEVTNGISIQNVESCFIIRNCWIDTGGSHPWAGIYLNNIPWSTASLMYNFLPNCYFGILLEHVKSSIIINNTCWKNWVGISLRNSESSTLINNTCLNNGYGIFSAYSSNPTIINNVCNQNSVTGISLHNSSVTRVINNTCLENDYNGIILLNCGNSTVIGNICSQNHPHGIYLCDTGNSLVTWNILAENWQYGVYLFSSYLFYKGNNNSIHHNTFLHNSQEGGYTSQAFDNGNNNEWFDSSVDEGNYWSDYDGTGEYKIDGSTGVVDPYPLDRAPIPTIITTDNLTTTEKITTNNLTSTETVSTSKTTKGNSAAPPSIIGYNLTEGLTCYLGTLLILMVLRKYNTK